MRTGLSLPRGRAFRIKRLLPSRQVAYSFCLLTMHFCPVSGPFRPLSVPVGKLPPHNCPVLMLDWLRQPRVCPGAPSFCRLSLRMNVLPAASWPLQPRVRLLGASKPIVLPYFHPHPCLFPHRKRLLAPIANSGLHTLAPGQYVGQAQGTKKTPGERLSTGRQAYCQQLRYSIRTRAVRLPSAVCITST